MTKKGDVVTVEAVDNAWAERLSRNAAITTGGSVFMADYAMTGAQAKKASIPARRPIASKSAVPFARPTNKTSIRAGDSRFARCIRAVPRQA